MKIDPATTPSLSIYKLMVGAVVPRPIAFVSTVSASGARNLAPFSFFNAVCAEPPVVCFSVASRSPNKDTLVNIRETSEFVVNIVSEEIAEHMNLASGEYARGIDEFEVSRLTAEPSDLIRPPRVRESHISMECKLRQILDVSPLPRGASLVLGEVVRFHVDESIFDDFRIDPDRLRAVGRMGGNGYTRTRDRFEMMRPKV